MKTLDQAIKNLPAKRRAKIGARAKARMLSDDSALKADGTAYVINDEMYNSYQRRGK